MKSIIRLILFFLRIFIIAVLPFIVFLRSAVWLHEHYSFPTFIVVLISMFVLIATLFLYLNIGYSFFFKRLGTAESLRQRFMFLSILVLVASVHILFFISDSQFKSNDLKNEYVSLHPILRLATGMVGKIDKSLVITDISRSKSDYTQMGLSINENSLHYPQKDGYCYAVDIRTKGKPEWITACLRFYYWSVGFKTLRHTGTADHLHISISCPKRLRK